MGKMANGEDPKATLTRRDGYGAARATAAGG